MAPTEGDSNLSERRTLPIYPAIGAVYAGIFHLFALLRLALHSGPIAMFLDDFFYYAVAARSYLHLGFTSFDGITITNGYHPAWLVILIQIMRFSGEHFLYATAVVVCALLALSTLLLERLLRLFGAPPGASIALALAIVAFLVPVLGRGMESALAASVLLGFCLFAQTSSFAAARDWLILGLLGSLLILSRIDALIFCLLYVVLLTASRDQKVSKLLANLLALAVGSLPVALYFVCNRIAFGAFMTVSSRAKELRTTRITSLLPLQGALHSSIAVLYLVSLLGLAMLFVSGSGRIRRPLALAALMFPFAQLFTLCLVSDWPLEVWYPYGLLASSPVALLILLRPAAGLLARPLRVSPATGLTSGILFFAALQAARMSSIPHDSIGVAARQIAAWSQLHPGKMAMGDRAGKVGWLLDTGPLQLEGLMADAPFLEHLRHQDDLQTVLRSYGIRYYITTNLVPHNGCFNAFEPNRTGPTSSRMHGVFCSPPVFVYTDTPPPGETHDTGTPNTVVTRIFDVGETRKPTASATSKETIRIQPGLNRP